MKLCALSNMIKVGKYEFFKPIFVNSNLLKLTHDI